MGQECPRKEVINLTGQHGKNGSQQAHKYGKKRNNGSKNLAGWVSKDFCHIQAYREIIGNDASPRAHTFHTVEDKHEHKTCSRRRHDKNGRNGMGAKEDKHKG